VRLDGLRQWVEQGYKQVQQDLGWADFPVRSDRAIHRHWALVCCAFCFCWWAEGRHHTAGLAPPPPTTTAPLALAPPAPPAPPAAQALGAGEKSGVLAAGNVTARAQGLLAAAVLAAGAAAGPELA
jgi:hypothetical protein